VLNFIIATGETSGAGTGGGITTITEGPGIDVTGAGTPASPLVITNTAPHVAPVRATATYTTGSLAAGAREVGIVAVAASYLLQRVQLSGTGRVRLYDTTGHRDADATRPPGTDPVSTADVGLMLDYAMQTAGTRTLSPMVTGASFEAAPTSVPITVDNLGGAAAALTVTLTFLRLE
jgi:hypothetical protein